MASYSWGITFAFYTRVKTMQTAGPRCHANRASLLLLSLAPALASNQEVAHRRKTYLHILDSTKTEWLQSIISSCWTFWVNCVQDGGRKRRSDRGTEGGEWSTGMNRPAKNHSQSDWWPFWPECNQGTAFEFQIPPHQMKTMSLFDHVIAWTAPLLPSQYAF